MTAKVTNRENNTREKIMIVLDACNCQRPWPRKEELRQTPRSPINYRRMTYRRMTQTAVSTINDNTDCLFMQSIK